MNEKSNKSAKPWISTVLLVVAAPLILFNLFSTANPVLGFTADNKVNVTNATTQAAAGTMTSYGIPLDNSGYQTLLGYDRSIDPGSLPAEKQAILKKLLGRDAAGKPIIPHPCCPAAISECAPCGHGGAIRGMIKYLLQQGWNEQDILSEAMVWDRLFFPGKVK
ncbi:Uncharacterised protein [uncultured archaeon]|nr:Uncharacterised protein [uncultured archaeon]